jgi:hypothetical protein
MRASSAGHWAGGAWERPLRLSSSKAGDKVTQKVFRYASVLRLFLLSFALLSLAGCGKETSRSAAALGSGDLRWNDFPVRLEADSALHDGAAADEDLLTAVAFWENRAGKHLFNVGSWPTGQPPYTGQAQDPDDLLGNAVFFLSPWPFDGHIAGKTIIHSNGSAIAKAVIFLNADTPLCSGLCEGEGEHSQTSRRKLIAHELGHFLGFAHVSDPDNIMYPEILPGGALDNLHVDEDLLHKLTVTF